MFYLIPILSGFIAGIIIESLIFLNERVRLILLVIFALFPFLIIFYISQNYVELFGPPSSAPMIEVLYFTVALPFDISMYVGFQLELGSKFFSRFKQE